MSVYAANLYDSIMLYAHGATTSLAHGVPLSEGAEVVARLKNVSFEGMTGRVQLDSRGDMLASLAIQNTRRQQASMSSELVAVYDAIERKYRPRAAIEWPGGTSMTPSDTGMQCSTCWGQELGIGCRSSSLLMFDWRLRRA